jgi:cysteine synthase
MLTLMFYVALFSDPTLGFQGQLDKVSQLKEDMPNVHVLDQFNNAANPEAHFKWTGTYSCTMQPNYNTKW